MCGRRPCDPAGRVRAGAGRKCRDLRNHIWLRLHGRPRRCGLQHVKLSWKKQRDDMVLQR